MYTNVWYDNYNQKIYLWEIINGKRFFDKIEHNVEYYIKDETGKSEVFDIYGIPVVKKIAKDKRNIEILKETGVDCYEADLMEDMKFLNKRYSAGDVEYKISDINICYLDIEVKSGDSFPKPEIADAPINLLTIKSSITGNSYTFGLKEYTGKEKLNYCYCVDEKDMLEKFISFFRKQRFDIVTGWNVKNFDIQYLINRFNRLGIKKTLSPINKIIQNKKTKEYTIVGISILDYMSLYKEFTFSDRESYSLQYIAMEELGRGKLEYEGQINDLYDRDWNTFVEYNSLDVNLVFDLESKLKFIELAINVSYSCLIPFEKVFSSIAQITGFMLKYLHRRNLVMPDRPHGQEDNQKEGAYVFANNGLYKNVVSFDVESQYPHMIMMYNISPETIIINPPDPQNYIETPNSGVFYKREKGILPQMVEEVFNNRKKFKKLKNKAISDGNKYLEEFYDKRQHVMKIWINSMFGVLGNQFFHFYNKTNFETITKGAKELIRYLSDNTNDYFKNYLYKNKNLFPTEDENNKLKNDPIVLIDTDSNYLCLDELKSKVAPNEDFVTWVNKLDREVLIPFYKKLIDNYVKKYKVKNIINFKREKIISKMIILAKKKYAALVLDNEGFTYKEPKIDITGIEIVRSSTPSFCRKRILNILDSIFENENRDTIIKNLKSIKEDFKIAPVDEISFPRGISDYEKYGDIDDIQSLNKGTPIANRAGIVYNHIIKTNKMKLQPIASGTKMKFIYVLDNNRYRTNIIGFIGKFPKEFESIFKIDVETQWRKTFQDVIDRFFEVLGWGKIDLSNDRLKNFINF